MTRAESLEDIQKLTEKGEDLIGGPAHYLYPLFFPSPLFPSRNPSDRPSPKLLFPEQTGPGLGSSLRLYAVVAFIGVWYHVVGAAGPVPLVRIAA